MSQKQTILGRIGRLARANINALIDRAEDPQKMLDQLVRDYSGSIAEAEEAVAVTIGNVRLAEQDHDADAAESREWGGKAQAASNKAEELRAAGDEGAAAKFDALAKVALTKQITAEREMRDAEPLIAAQNETVEKLKAGLVAMRTKLAELTSKRDELVARAASVAAQSTVQDAISSIDALDPTTEVARFEDEVRREEARVAGHAEIQGDSLEQQFAELEDHTTQTEVEARLAALKGPTTLGQIER